MTDGSAKLMIGFQKAVYFLPVCLLFKALMNVTDYFIYERLVSGMEDDTYYTRFVFRHQKWDFW